MTARVDTCAMRIFNAMSDKKIIKRNMSSICTRRNYCRYTQLIIRRILLQKCNQKYLCNYKCFIMNNSPQLCNTLFFIFKSQFL